MFERLRAAINAALEAATPPPNLRDLSGQMREAVIEVRAAVSQMRDGLEETERQVAAERTRRDDAERRAGLAEGIQDAETAAVARRYTAKHAERFTMLENKLIAQRAELVLTERELADMTTQLKTVERGIGRAGASAEAAWQDITAAGGVRPGQGLEDEVLREQTDRVAREAAAEEQLRALKKKMGK